MPNQVNIDNVGLQSLQVYIDIVGLQQISSTLPGHLAGHYMEKSLSFANVDPGSL